MRSVLLSVLVHAGVITLLASGWLWFKRSEPPKVAGEVIEAVLVERARPTLVKPRPQPPPTPRSEPEPQQKPVPLPPAQKAVPAVASPAPAATSPPAPVPTGPSAAEIERERERRERQAAAAADAARQRAAQEQELRRQLEAEERANAARLSGIESKWIAEIRAAIERAWIRPPAARSGIDCTVAVAQVPGGSVVNVRILSCNGDDAVRQSIEAAVYRASPLPPPADEALFERNLELRFRPND